MKMIWTILLTFFICFDSYGQQVEKIIQSGNEFYKKEQYEKAASQYNKAIVADSSSITALFNLGNSLYKKNSRNEAIKAYTDITEKTNDTGLRSDSYYNAGVVLGKQQKLELSIETYKKALRQNPDNTEARDNLQKALLELRKRVPPKKEPEKKKQNQQQQSKMSPKEAQQRLKLMEQKEKEVQQRMQKEKSKAGGGQAKDW